MTRTIHPVGQGAFYSETISDKNNIPVFTAVYDCGGKVDLLSNEIDKLSRVDIVFISHFHCDHINRVQELIKRFKPGKVVFPQVSAGHFFVDFVFNCARDKNREFLSSMLHFLPILRLAESGNANDLRIDNTLYVPIKSPNLRGKPFPSKLLLWEYIAFYNENVSSVQTLEKELYPLFGLSDDSLIKFQEKSFYEKIARRLKDDERLLEKVKEAYSKAFHRCHNSYSMIVLSRQIDKIRIEDKKFDCLYTGDVSVDNWVLGVASTYEPDYIQVPHHGSNHNHNSYLYTCSNIVFVSVGITNRYRHPGLITLPNIINTCKEVHIVTEDNTTRLKRSILF